MVDLDRDCHILTGLYHCLGCHLEKEALETFLRRETPRPQTKEEIIENIFW